MAKQRISYICQNCGSRFAQWAGRCSICGEWNTIEEETVELATTSNAVPAEPAELTALGDIPPTAANRLLSGLSEFDRVLGGDNPGLVSGSVILIAGSPGVGKSTLLLEVASTVKGAVYFSAEESLQQIHLRARRLSLGKNELLLSAERNINKIISAVKNRQAPLVVIDSIQTVYDDQLAGAPGSIVQVRDNAWRLQQLAKQMGISILLVGHVTKEGAVAGPRVLEHLVDVVLYLEGEKRTGLRILRAEKNRFGSTEEVGIWQITSKGFEAVTDPGRVFADLLTADVPGRAITITIEGTRAFVIEIQALVTPTAFGYPKRTAQGIDANRLTLLLAVLENRLGLPFSKYDVYVNVVGGFTVKDTGIDLAVAAAVISGLNKKSLPDKQVLYGEVGLLGEIRPAFDSVRRQKEAKRLDYSVAKLDQSVRSLARLFT